MDNSDTKETKLNNRTTNGFLLLFILITAGLYSSGDTLPYRTSHSSETLAVAQADLRIIAAEPHMSGSAAHKKVRDYIVSELETIGINAQIEKGHVVSNYKNETANSVTAAYVENIIAKLEGTSDLPAIALMAHYDSRDSNNGAGDDAAGVVAILAAARELARNNNHLRDVYFIFTDLEEYGLLGSQQFYRDNPIHQKIELVINFEGRGTSGPSTLFETSEGNYSLLKHSSMATKIKGSSILYSVYKNMNNDTDLSLAKEAGIQGLNFAFADGFFDYHAGGDTAENLSSSSLMDQLNYAIDLSYYFANLEKSPIADDQTQSSNATFFNPIPGSFIVYGKNTTYLIGILAILTSLFWLYKQNAVTNVKSTIKGFFISLFTVFIIGLIITVLNNLLFKSFDVGTARFWRILYQYHYILIAYVLIVFGLLLGLMVVPSRKPKIKTKSISTGIVIVWILCLILSLTTVPYASYLFAWPLLLLSTMRLILNSKNIKVKLLLSSLELMVISLLVFPLGYLMYVLVGYAMPSIPIALLALSLLLAAPSLEMISKSFSQLFIWLIIIGIILLTVISQRTVFNERHAQPSSIYYLQDENNDQQYWSSNLTDLYGWDKEVMGENPKSIKSDIIWPNSNDQHLVKPITKTKLDKAQITVLEDTSEDLIRKLKIQIKSPMHAEYLNLFFKPTIWHQASLEGIEVPDLPPEEESQEWWRWRYYAIPPEGITLDLVIAANQPFEMRVIEVIYSNKNKLKPPQLPKDHMPLPYGWSHSNVIIQDLDFSYQ